ncbi:type III-B CRISPR-associated protein Cas10/Cmr2 [Thermococcus prieurii]
MNPWESYAWALLEVAPSRILASLLGEYELPERWKHLSSFPVTGKFTLEKFVLKHPISAKEKPLEKLSSFWFNSTDEEKLKFVGALKKAEESVARKIEDSGSVEKFAKLWNNLPELLREEYEKVLEGLGLSPAIAGELVHFPADPYVPDHDWLSRLDVYAQLKNGKVKLLRFKISPVQGFIGNARTERDLWAGSHMLGLLTYTAISEIWKLYGPNALIFPHLRGQPFFEHELGEIEDYDKLDVANIPNKVLALIPEDANVDSLSSNIRAKIQDLLERLFRSAWEFYGLGPVLNLRKEYVKTIREYFSITVETAPLTKLPDVIEKGLKEYLLELPDGFESDVHYYSELFTILDQKTDFKSAQHFPPEQPMGFKCTLCGENLAIGGDADHSVVKSRWDSIRDKLRKRGVYDIKEGERLCPLCLAKRFYPRFYSLWKDDYGWLSRSSEDITYEAREEHRRGSVRLKRFASVSEVAMRRPTEVALELAGNDELETDGKPVTWHDVFLYTVFHTGARNEWRGEVEEPKFKGTKAGEFIKGLMALSSALMPTFRKLGPNSEVLYPENLRDKKALAKVYGVPGSELPSGTSPEVIAKELSNVSGILGDAPKYYAILKMDGDNMGKVISGSKSVKPVEDYLAVKGLESDVKRPVTPTVHIAITRSLSEFAVNFVPKLSEEHGGELLYAGGDDVFAIVPTDRVFSLAFEIQDSFREDWKDFSYLQGKTRSMSAGVLILHYKEPFYLAVRRVNELEHLAKESGRNAIAIGYLKHSGSYHRVVLNWRALEDGHYADFLEGVRNGKISTKFIYELNTETWPNDAYAALMLLKYEFLRHSNYKKDEDAKMLEHFAELLWLVRNVRSEITANELEELGVAQNKDVVGRINETVRDVVVDDPENEEPSDSFEDVKGLAKAILTNVETEGVTWFEELRKRLSSTLQALNLPDVSAEIAGIIVKKQIKGASRLLKILLETGVRA